MGIDVLGIWMSILISIAPLMPRALAPEATSFLCDGRPVEAQIYNNENGDYKQLEAYEELDAGAFVVIKLENVQLMLPRTFNAGETSFTDRKWLWSYEDHQHPTFKLVEPKGNIREFSCEAIPSDGLLGGEYS